jgi:outer membrane protein assembly factor BamB
MKRSIQLISAIFIIAFLTGCTTAGTASSWPAYTTTEQTGYYAYGPHIYALENKNGNLLWKFPQEADNAKQYYAAPAIDYELVVVGDYKDTLTALDAGTGTKKWDFISAKDRYIAPALITDKAIYAPNTDHYLYAVDRSGSLLWRFKAEGPNWTKPVSDGNLIIYASMDHHVYAFLPEYELESLTMGDDGSRTLVQSAEWVTDLGVAIVADPLVYDSKVFVGTINGDLYCLDAANGKIIWSFNDNGNVSSIWGSPVLFHESLFFADESGQVYALSPDSGKAIWLKPFSAGSSVVAGGVVTEEGVAYASKEGKVFIIDEDQNLSPVASLDTPIYSTPSLVNGFLILAPTTKEKLFTAVDLDGKEIWGFLPSK